MDDRQLTIAGIPPDGGRPGGGSSGSLTAGKVGWLAAQRHSGHNIGDTDSHVIFVELKEGAPTLGGQFGPVGPAVS